jgi:uncharacterized Zn finger protein
MTRGPARFSPEALRSRAGDRTYERGAEYHRAGQVTILSLDAERVVARVSGSEDYRTELAGKGLAIGGECSCPAYDDGGFCKHMVAVALAASDATDGGTPADPMAPVRAWLEAQPAAALAAMLLDRAERDQALLRRLEVAAAAAGAGDAASVVAGLKRALDSATHSQSLPEYREVRDWAADIKDILDAIKALADGPEAESALGLADHALARIREAIRHIDDSSGHGLGLLEHARDAHLAACCGLRPDPSALARDLFERETEDGYGTFYAAAHVYEDALGPTGRAEYLRLARAAWDRLPPSSPATRKERLDDDPVKLHRLFAILDGFAVEDGDIEARIALRARHLASPYDYLGLAELCRDNGRAAEALARAEEGLWIFEDQPMDERLLGLAVTLLREAGREPEAEAHLWRAFERRPSLKLYHELRAVGGEPARDRAIARLEADLHGAKRTRWDLPADLLVRVLIEEGLHDRAWALAGDPGISDGLAETLARASEASHPREALAVYARRVEKLAELGGNPNYAGAVELVARMARLRDAAEQAAYVADLKARHRAKRNLMKLLA